MLKFAQPQLDEDTIQAVAAVLRSNWIATGPKVAELERALSESFGSRPTRVVTSATGAMEIALQVCGIGPGDEVITSAQSFFSAMNMIVKVGATPVFVDCDLHTRAIDLAQVEAAITPRTKAIMPTHFPGALGDIDALHALAKRHQLRVIEDAALVQGSYWKDQPIGGFGDIATFSFHPNKNMTTIEGGAIVVASEDEAKLVDVLRFHGIQRLPDDTRDVAIAAGKFNMSDVSAVIAQELPRCVAGAGYRHRHVLRSLPPDHGRPAIRLHRRPVPERRAHRARNCHLAAACGYVDGRRRPCLRCCRQGASRMMVRAAQAARFFRSLAPALPGSGCAGWR